MGRTDEYVRRIVDLISSTLSNTKPLMHDTATPAAFQEDNFRKSLKNILQVKRSFVNVRWCPLFCTNLREMLSSHKNYFTHVLFACCMEEYIDPNIFERFLNVCCTVVVFCIYVHDMTEVNFYKSNVDIIMVYYEKILRKKFNKCGGIRQLVEYICQHKYATWEPITTDHGLYYDSITSQVITKKNLCEKFLMETEKLKGKSSFRSCGSRETTIAERLASEVLSISKTELPILPRPEDLEAKLQEFRKEKSAAKQRSEKMAQDLNDFDVKLPGKSILNSSSEPKEAEPKMNNALCEKIVEAVVRYNNSKSSLKASSDNIFYIEACQVLHHLKDTIESVIKVLEQIDDQ